LYPAAIKREQALIIALIVCAAACFAALRADRAPAQSAVEKFNSIQSKLDQVQGRQQTLTTTISSYNDRIRELRGQIADLRNREAVVQEQLDAVQAQLNVAIARLVQLRAHLERAIEVLSERLVDIYKSNEPDILTVILESNGFDDVLAQSDYLSRIQSMDSDVVGRVRELRDQTHDTVTQIRDQRNEVAARKAEIDRTHDELAARNAEMAAARDKQQAALKAVGKQKDDLEGDLSKVSDEVAKQLGGGGPLVAGPIRDGGHGLIWPVNGPITSGFGPRNIGNGYEFHPGIDISVPTGTGIRAAADGRVTIAGPTGGYGNYTCIDHGGGLSTCYGHQEAFAVVVGMEVHQGQIIGRSDCTGYCTGPHVHFEVRVNGQVTDPLNYF
jgi:murein DD-endopeptidase MepM/ murein hydrolase activator NlpD